MIPNGYIISITAYVVKNQTVQFPVSYFHYIWASGKRQGKSVSPKDRHFPKSL